MKNKVFLLVIVLCIIACGFSVGSVYAQKPDYQQILVNYYTQQLVAHGAMLFAASAAAFTFVRAFVKKNKAFSVLVFIVLGGLLLGLVIFLGFRLLYYGALTNGVVNFPIPSNKYFDSNLTLANYAQDVNSYSLGEAFNTSLGTWQNETYGNSLPHLLRNFLQNARFDYSLNPFSGFCFSMYFGIFLAFVIFYSFGRYSFMERDSFLLWILYFLPSLVFILFIASGFSAPTRIAAIIVYYIIAFYECLLLLTHRFLERSEAASAICSR